MFLRHDRTNEFMTAGNARAPLAWQGRVSSVLAGSFAEFSCHHGARLAELLAYAEISERTLDDPEARLPLKQFARLVREAKRQTGLTGLPVLFANEADFSEVSIAGLIANASKTMLDALTQLNRYSRLTFDLPFEGPVPLVIQAGTDADWIVDTRHAASVFPEIVEFSFTYLVTGPKRFLMEPHVLSVDLSAPEPNHADLVRHVWGCPVRWGQSENRIQMPRWVADHPVRLQPAYAFGILTAHADQMLETIQASTSLRARIEALILPRLHTGEVTITWVSDQLGQSRQSIYRTLKAEGTTFETLLDELRHKLALDYLAGRKVSVSETAYLLGFADPSPFSRAFKRWTGVSPSAYRLRLE